MNTTSQEATVPRAVEAGAWLRLPGDRALWGFVVAVGLLFWAPELVLYMGWADYWIIFLTEVCIWSMFACAFNLLMGHTGLISFGQAAYLGIGGYTAGLLLKNIDGLPFAVGLAAAPVGGALAALIIGFFCVRRTHIYFAILTLAFGHIVYLILFKWYDVTGGDNGLIGVPVPEWVEDPTFSNYYKFVLVVCGVGIYLLRRIVNSPFGRTLVAIRENDQRADFIGVNVRRYKLYAFVVAGAFSGLAGALIMFNERSVYPDLAHWTQSAQVLLMSLLGGVHTFFGPVVGALVLQTMDADITQDYPEIWQLFLGAVLVLILFGLPGGIVGFITGRGATTDADPAARVGRALGEFSHKFWFFFLGALAFAAFFSILKAPEAWLTSPELDFETLAPRTWGVVPRTALQAAVGTALFLPLLGGARAFSRRCRLGLLVLAPLVPLLHVYLRTPLSGLLVMVLWVVYVYYFLLQPDVRRAFRTGAAAAGAGG